MIQNQAKPDAYTVRQCPTRIYLIITTSIENRYGLQHDVKRKDQYISAISETLMKMFLSAARKQTDVALRHELKDQMMDVTLYEEPCKGV